MTCIKCHYEPGFGHHLRKGDDPPGVRKTVRGEIVRSVMWWIYYGLFLGLCIFIFVTVARYGIHMLFMEQRKLNGAQILYGVAVGVMIFGLLSMSIAYLTRSIWYRIKGPPGKRGENLPPNRVLGDKPREVPPPSSQA